MANLKPYTVVAYDEDSTQINSFHVMATNGLHAFSVAANENPGRNLMMVVAADGHIEEDHGLAYPGACLVDSATVLEQTDVFGPSEDSGSVPAAENCTGCMWCGLKQPDSTADRCGLCESECSAVVLHPIMTQPQAAF